MHSPYHSHHSPYHSLHITLHITLRRPPAASAPRASASALLSPPRTADLEDGLGLGAGPSSTPTPNPKRRRAAEQGGLGAVRADDGLEAIAAIIAGKGVRKGNNFFYLYRTSLSLS